MSYHHSTTAIASNAELIKNLDGPVSGSHPQAERFPLISDQLSAREASNRYDHFFLPVRFLFSTPWTGSAELFGLGNSLISCKHYSVESYEILSKLAALSPRS